jgi:hypothetical protein
MSWTKLYATARWRKRSAFHRKQHPMCAECERQGRTHEAHLAHHITEYWPGATDLHFFFGPLESLCFSCHLEKHGRPPSRPYRRDIGLDGIPLDPQHPYWVEERRQQERERKWQKPE